MTVRGAMRAFAAAAAVSGLVLAGSMAGSTSAVAAPQPINPDDCKRAPGASAPRSTWALDQLQLARTNPVTRGRDVKTGAPVKIAVVDSGLDRTNPQLKGVNAAAVRSAVADDPGKDYDDCVGHGTQVTAIIAAQPDAAHPQFVGVAPQARIIPIKVTNTASDIAVADVVRGIDDAVAAGAKIINLSLTFRVDYPQVRAAVKRAGRAGVLIVAAAGNDNNDKNQLTPYPAAYAPTLDNVIGVSATTPTNTIAQFAQAGSFVGVAAPGDGVQTLGVSSGYIVQQGTSFAAPFVTGVAALVLAAHPGISPRAIRDRIEATAAAPPATVPDDKWGYGTVDPYLAVTSLRVDAPAAAPSITRGPPVAANAAVRAPDNTLRDTALAIGVGLLGLSVIVTVAASVFRVRRRVGARA